MLEQIDPASSVPIYTQIEKQVQFAIASGKLKSDDRLPNARELSERLGVNLNTVSKAYRDLQLMGCLRVHRNTGVFVARGCEERCRQDVHQRILDQLREVAGEARAAGMDRDEVVKTAENAFSK